MSGGQNVLWLENDMLKWAVLYRWWSFCSKSASIYTCMDDFVVSHDIFGYIWIVILGYICIMIVIFGYIWRFWKSATLKHTIHDVSFGVSKLMNPATGRSDFIAALFLAHGVLAQNTDIWGWSRKSCAWFSPREIQLHIPFRFLYYATIMWYEMIFEITRNWYEPIGNDINHMTWYEMAWNDMKWYEMICLGIPPLNFKPCPLTSGTPPA